MPLVTCPECGEEFELKEEALVTICPVCSYQYLNMTQENIDKAVMEQQHAQELSTRVVVEEEPKKKKELPKRKKVLKPPTPIFDSKPKTKKELRKAKRKNKRIFRLRVLGGAVLIFLFSGISGACGLIPIPFLSFLPFIVSVCLLEVLLYLIFGKLKKGAVTKVGVLGRFYFRTANKTLVRLRDAYLIILFAVNTPGNVIKAIPYIGTMIGMVFSIVSMALSTIIDGLMVYIPFVLSGPDDVE